MQYPVAAIKLIERAWHEHRFQKNYDSRVQETKILRGKGNDDYGIRLPQGANTLPIHAGSFQLDPYGEYAGAVPIISLTSPVAV
jgi:hypothetical protein